MLIRNLFLSKGSLLVVVFVLSGCGSPIELTTQSLSNTPEPEPISTSAETPLPLSKSVTLDMILIPAGDFIMGLDADVGLSICMEMSAPYTGRECKRSWFEDHEPVHTVYLDDFYIDKYEVTNADYQACVTDGVCEPPETNSSKTRDEYFGNPNYADYPVIYVNWHDAVTFCEWRGARLPTEAEWEKAARGTEGRIYPWGDDFDGNLGNFCDRDYGYDDGYTDTAPVGSYPEGASPYGVMDMAGNVWEWTADWFSPDYFQESPSQNPQGPPSGSGRVWKGSPFNCESPFLDYTANRGGVFPDLKWNMLGFRCAVSSQE